MISKGAGPHAHGSSVGPPSGLNPGVAYNVAMRAAQSAAGPPLGISARIGAAKQPAMKREQLEARIVASQQQQRKKGAPPGPRFSQCAAASRAPRLLS
jgi:hypothetical protein